MYIRGRGSGRVRLFVGNRGSGRVIFQMTRTVPISILSIVNGRHNCNCKWHCENAD